MSDPYKRVKVGRLAFKGGDLATVKSIDKKKRKKKKKKEEEEEEEDVEKHPDVDIGGALVDVDGEEAAVVAGGDVYTIDAAKKMKYEELFPVETRKFGYDPANMSRSTSRTVEEALDDRVKKKADRYCK